MRWFLVILKYTSLSILVLIKFVSLAVWSSAAGCYPRATPWLYITLELVAYYYVVQYGFEFLEMSEVVMTTGSSIYHFKGLKILFKYNAAPVYLK